MKLFRRKEYKIGKYILKWNSGAWDVYKFDDFYPEDMLDFILEKYTNLARRGNDASI